jgi:GTP pyrophosphokinase
MKINCNARLRDINEKIAISLVATTMNLNNHRVEEWFEKNHCESVPAIALDIEHFKHVIHKYIAEISKNSRFQGFISKHRFKLKMTHIAGLDIYAASSIGDVVFDYCCHPKSGDEVMGFLDKNRVNVHHKMCKVAAKKLESEAAMVFVSWAHQKRYKYKLIASLHNEKGALAEFLTFLVKLNIDISTIELGKESEDYTKYCELEFETKEADVNRLRGKIDKKIKVIHLVRSDDAYKN